MNEKDTTKKDDSSNRLPNEANSPPDGKDESKSSNKQEKDASTTGSSPPDEGDATFNLFEIKGTSRKEWKYVRLVPKKEKAGLPKSELKSDDASHAYCLLCKSKITYSRGNGNSVYRHMARFHSKQMSKHVEKNDKRRKGNDGKAILSKDSSNNDTAFETQGTSSPLSSSSSIRGSQLHGEAILVKWTAESMRPFKILQDPSFVEFCTFLCKHKKRFQVPSVEKHKDQVMKIARSIKDKATETMANEMKHFCITTDIWSPSQTILGQQLRYLGITVHYLTEDFQMKQFIVEATPVTCGKEVGVFVSNRIEQAASSYGIDLNDMTLVLREGGSNCSPVRQMLGRMNFGCIGHSFHLIVGPLLLKRGNDRSGDEGATAHQEDTGEGDDDEDEEDDDRVDMGLDEQDEMYSSELIGKVCDIVSRLREVAKFITDSPDAQIKVSEHDEKMMSDILLPTKKRWDSSLDMLLGMVKIQDPILAFLRYLKSPKGMKEFHDERTLPSFSEEELVLAEGISLILSPFRSFMSYMAGGGKKSPTIAQALPHLLHVRSFLESANGMLFDRDATTCQPMKMFLDKHVEKEYFALMVDDLKEVCNILSKSFRSIFSGMDIDLMWITILHPVYRQMKHLSGEEYKEAKNKLVDEVTAVTWSRHQQATKLMEKNTSDVQKKGKGSVEGDPFLDTSVLDSPKRKEDNRSGMGGDGGTSSGTMENLLNTDHHDDGDNDDDSMKKTTDDLKVHEGVVLREVEHYLNYEVAVPHGCDPLGWWSYHRFQFPNVAVVARKWLSIPASLSSSSSSSMSSWSTESNRVFSNCSGALNDVTVQRRKNVDEKVCELMDRIMLRANVSNLGMDAEDIAKVLDR